MAFAPSASSNSRSITHLANYPSPSLPMISSDESSFAALPQLVAVRGLERQPVNAAQFLDFFQGLGGEGRLTFEGMQHDALQQVAERHVLQFGQSFEDLQQSLFHADASLDSFDDNGVFELFFHSTNVPIYQGTIKTSIATHRCEPGNLYRSAPP